MTDRGFVLLYDGPTGLGPAEYERLLQGLIWVGDAVLMPSHATPSPFLALDEQRRLRQRLGALAEAGLVQRWRVDLPMPQVAEATWWPEKTSTALLERDQYLELQSGVRESVHSYRDDVMRGIGRKPGSMTSGITEFIQLQETFWTLGLSRSLGADSLLSTQRRADQIMSPLLRDGFVSDTLGPVSETIMQLKGVGPLASLSMRDLRRLRKHLPSVRRELASIAARANRQVLTPKDARRYSQIVAETAQKRYAEILGEKLAADRTAALRSTAGGVGVTVAGTIFPPLGALGFVQPLLALSPTHRDQKHFLLFLSKLQKRTQRRSA